MARKPRPAKWITFTAEKFVRDALEAHRQRLEAARGGQHVSSSEAARDAILQAAAKRSA